MQIGENILNGSIYPGRLAPAPMPFKFRESRTISADHSYSLVNLIMMFFIFCFVGWVWEVSLAFISEDMFVNRGTLHGPWLPIYGTGGVIILVLLKKLREKPALEFVAAMVLCGCLEYFSSWYLEMTHDGQRWWDYTGYFLNINGRICAEGLLTFGLGGLAIVYLLAPASTTCSAESMRESLASCRRAARAVLRRPSVFRATSECRCGHHRLQGIGHVAGSAHSIRIRKRSEGLP